MTIRSDRFFTQTTCDRCHTDLTSRTMSWFTTETICLSCSAKEDEIKKALRAKGVEDAMEGCGFIPIQGKDYCIPPPNAPAHEPNSTANPLNVRV